MMLVLYAQPLAAEKVYWLYEVEVAVESQSTTDRIAASKQALAILLTRLTGQPTVLQNPDVVAALTEPDLYYNRYDFLKHDGELRLRIRFDKISVTRFINDARLPIWSSNRPRVVIWLVASTPTGRQVVDAASEHPLVAIVRERARTRGLPIVFPIMDLEDQLRVTPAVVWGRLSQVLEPAAERYQAEYSIVGRVQTGPGDTFKGGWRYWLDNREVQSSLRDPGAIIDLLADDLAAKYAVVGTDWHYHTAQIVGVDTVAAYGALLSYLNSLEYLDGLRVLEVRPNSLLVALRTRSSDAKLMELLTIDERLLPREGTGINLDKVLVWQEPE